MNNPKTNQAAMQEARLTDAEIQDIADGFDIYGAKPEFARAVESAVLSKLRAPVADERVALADLLEYVDSNTCIHESTHRGGAIWTICDGCGAKWADDEGGFVPHQDAPAVAAARAALASAPVAEEASTNRAVTINPDAPSLTLAMNATPLEKDFAKVLSDNFDSLLIRSDSAQPVAKVRHFNYSGVARNGFSQEAVFNDDAPSLPDGTLLYAAPQASEAVRNAAQALIDHANRAERTRGEPFPETFHNPLTGRTEDNGLVVPVRLLRDISAALSAQPGAQKKGGSDA